MSIIIRKEEPADYAEVKNVVKMAFATAANADGGEHHLVERLRGGAAFVPELSLVAESNGKIVGHILFTKLKLHGTEQLALAPLSVLPEFQRQGIGRKLIAAGHEAARKKGFDAVVVLGNPKVYGSSGYKPARLWKISSPFEAPDAYFMVCELKKGALPVKEGCVEYAEEFGIF